MSQPHTVWSIKECKMKNECTRLIKWCKSGLSSHLVLRAAAACALVREHLMRDRLSHHVCCSSLQGLEMLLGLQPDLPFSRLVSCSCSLTFEQLKVQPCAHLLLSCHLLGSKMRRILQTPTLPATSFSPVFFALRKDVSWVGFLFLFWDYIFRITLIVFISVWEG